MSTITKKCHRGTWHQVQGYFTLLICLLGPPRLMAGDMGGQSMWILSMEQRTLVTVLLVTRSEEQVLRVSGEYYFVLIRLKLGLTQTYVIRTSHQPDVSCLVKTVAGCIYNVWKAGRSKPPENISNSPGCCCYGYRKGTKFRPTSMNNVCFSVYQRAKCPQWVSYLWLHSLLSISWIQLMLPGKQVGTW